MNSVFLFVFACIFLIGFVIVAIISNFYSIAYQKAQLFTPTEFKFFKILKLATYDKYDIFTQVRMASLVRPKRHVWRNFQPLAIRSIDYVLADKTTGDTLLVIELDDYTHDRSSRRFRDHFIDRVLKASNIPILRVKVESFYDIQKLSQQIQSSIITI